MKRTRLNLEPLESRQMMAVWSPGLRISDATVDEGGLATLTVTRDNISYLSASVKWATASGSAGASDYAGASGTLKFGSRELSKTITIPTKEDTLVEGLESFVVNLTSAKYGTIKDKQGIVTIRDNDTVTPPPVDPPPAATTIYSLSLVAGQRYVAAPGTVLELGSGQLRIPSNASVEGLIIRDGRPASEWEASVMLASGAKLINCEVTGGRYAGVMMGSNTLVEGCNIHHNARTGIKADYASNGIVRNNDIHHNNPDKAFDPYDEAGGSKFWATTGFIFENNKFRDNIGNGLWLDYDNRDYIIRNNQTSDNTLAGIFVEISYSGLIENNTGTRDGDGYSVSGWGNGAGIVIENSSGTSSKPIVIRNNTTIDCTNGVMIIHVDGRSEETHGGNYETEWIQVTDCDLRNSGKNGWVGDRPSNVTWLHNTLSGNSRLVGGF